MKQGKAPLPLWFLGAAMSAGLLLGGCASDGAGPLGSGVGVTASDPTRATRSGFLTDYALLKPVSSAGGAECWRSGGFDAKRYSQVLIAPIIVMLKPDQEQAVDPADLKSLTDYFHASLTKALEPQLTPTGQSGPDVLVMRIALTDLVPTSVARSVTGSLVPYAFVAEAGSGVATGRPPGATPYLGETGMELQLRDGDTDAVLAECRDTEIGRKYAAELNAGVTGAAQTWASGYLNSFQSWAYARNAFDKWSSLAAQRLAALRGGSMQR